MHEMEILITLTKNITTHNGDTHPGSKPMISDLENKGMQEEDSHIKRWQEL